MLWEMGVKLLTALVCSALLLAAAAVGAWALDSSRSGEIAHGVSAGGVALGGMDRREATAELKRELIRPAQKPIRVIHGPETFTLPARDLKIDAGIGAMVTEALAVSRQGDLPSRVVRHLTGGMVEHAIPAEVTYSRTAVERFVARLASEINRPAVDAAVEPGGAQLTITPGRAGRALAVDELRDDILDLLEQGARRDLEAKVETVEPSVTRSELAVENPDYIVVDRSSFTLRHYEGLELVKEYTVAIGQQGYDTPAGLYAIESMQVDPTWYVPDAEWAGDLAGKTVPPGPDNPLKARWMGFNGAAGIHGTADEASLGSAASHGCVRMSVPDVKELYERVSVGTPVYIE